MSVRVLIVDETQPMSEVLKITLPETFRYIVNEHFIDILEILTKTSASNQPKSLNNAVDGCPGNSTFELIGWKFSDSGNR